MFTITTPPPINNKAAKLRLSKVTQSSTYASFTSAANRLGYLCQRSPLAVTH
jgi:hypothetical protein